LQQLFVIILGLLCNVWHRELEEESGVIAKSLRQIGLLIFEFIGEPQLLEVHVYSTEEFDGTVVESEGMSGRVWFLILCSINNICAIKTLYSS